MAVVKVSSRTLREKDGSPRKCRDCGQSRLYWGQDENSGKFELVNANETTRAIAKDGIVPGEHLHRSTCPAAKDAESDSKPTDDPSPDDDTSEGENVPQTDTQGQETAPTMTTTDSSDAFAAFQTFVSSISPKVDRAEVEAMIREAVGEITVPTRTVVERASGETVTIEGAHESLPSIVTATMAGMHVMMVGPAGSGKTTIAAHVAESLGLQFRAISCHPAMSPTPLVGFIDANGKYHRTAFRDCFEHGGVFLFDEIDNSHPSVLAAMNSALANGHMEFPDGPVEAHGDFRVIAAGNTYGRGADSQYVGRNPLDAATLDRFAMVTVDYDVNLETELCKATGLDGAEVTKVLGYVREVRAKAMTTAHEVRKVVSPRASIGMCKLLRDGMTFGLAAELMLWKGASEADRRVLTN